MTERTRFSAVVGSEIRALLPPKYQDRFDELLSRILALPDDQPEVPDWFITAIVTAPEDMLTPRLAEVKRLFNEGKITQIPTKSDVTAIHEAVITSSAISAEAIENVKDKHAAPRWVKVLSQSFEHFTGGLKLHLDEIVKTLLDQNLIPDDLGDELKQAAKGNAFIYAIPIAFMQIYSWWKNYSIRLKSWGLNVERAANKKYGGNIPDWHDLINIAFYDDTVRAQVIDIMLSLGIPEQYHDALLKTAKTVLSTSEIMSLFWRGEIDVDQRTDLLHKAGITGDEERLILTLFDRVPNIQDAIQFAVKDVFNPEAVRMMGLDEDYPDQLTEFAAKNGFSEENAKRYWQAHWNALSPQMVFEMLHRGVVDFQSADDLLRIADWPAGLRDMLMQISYSVPTRVDVRRMYRLGVYDQQQVFENYLKLGYNEEDAVSLTQFTVLNESESERELTRSQVEAAYRDGVLDARDAAAFLKKIGYQEDLVEIIIDRIDLQAEQDIIEQELDILKTRYTRQLMDTSQLEEQLTKLRIDPAQIQIYIRQWGLDREKKIQRPSLATLRRWYKSGVISADDFRVEMRGLGWGDHYIDLYELEISQT